MDDWEKPWDADSAISGLCSYRNAFLEAQTILTDTRMQCEHPGIVPLKKEVRSLQGDAIVRGLEIIMFDRRLAQVENLNWSHLEPTGEGEDDPTGLIAAAEADEEPQAGGVNAYFAYMSQFFPGGIAPCDLSDEESYTDCDCLSDELDRTVETHYRIANDARAKFMLALHYPSFLPLLQASERSRAQSTCNLMQIAEYYDNDRNPHNFLHEYLARHLAAQTGSSGAAHQLHHFEMAMDPAQGFCVADEGQGQFDIDKAQRHAKALWRMALSKNSDLSPEA
jgi:hypothetical protein